MKLEEHERQMILGALDSLGVALTDKGHTWSDGERTIYEQAVELLKNNRPDNNPPVVVVGLHSISLLMRGHTVNSGDAFLTPADDLMNESRNMEGAVRYDA